MPFRPSSSTAWAARSSSVVTLPFGSLLRRETVALPYLQQPAECQRRGQMDMKKLLKFLRMLELLSQSPEMFPYGKKELLRDTYHSKQIVRQRTERNDE